MKIESNSPSSAWLGKALLATAFAVFASAGCQQRPSESNQPPTPAVTFKPQEMADALHAVIAADREVYTLQAMRPERRDEQRTSSEEKRNGDAGLPLPAHLLRMGSEVVQKNGAEFHYILRSLRPINPRNAPQTEVEKSGLQFVAQHPGTNYYAEESLGGRRYLTAVYPDLVTSHACADCHNQHQDKAVYQPGDVIGGIIVRVPLEF
jgi:hypothetical protein